MLLLQLTAGPGESESELTLSFECKFTKFSVLKLIVESNTNKEMKKFLLKYGQNVATTAAATAAATAALEYPLSVLHLSVSVSVFGPLN